AQNQLWCEIVALACELLAWTQMLALAGAARCWEPKRLRLRLFSVAGRLASSGRRLQLRLATNRPWARQVTAAATPPQALPPASPHVRRTGRTGRNDQEGEPPGPVEPRPPGATAGKPGTARS